MKSLDLPRSTYHLLERPLTRSDYREQLDHNGFFDLVVVGGGIHGAACARIAAFNGIKTLLLEKRDYAGETSSRSSKMIHGGLRYLEMFDFKQVFEGIRAREDLFFAAAHNVRPEKFLIPVFARPRSFGPRLKLALSFYDLLVKEPQRTHRWVSANALATKSFSRETVGLKGCFEYFDGLMDDTRLTLDTITDARLRGAMCLNYAQVTHVERLKSGTVALNVHDALLDSNFKVTTRLVLNCTGPWAPFIGRDETKEERTDKVRYSQGTHLLFNQKWSDPSLFLPLEEQGRYYFVWPHPEGTLVGTTEREVNRPIEQPLPFPDEIEEILARLQKDIPHMGLSRDKLHYAFAGIRTLPVRESARKTSEISRRHIWNYGDGILTLYGGKYTTAYWTAHEGLLKACELIQRPKPRSLYGVQFEGTTLLSETNDYREKLKKRGIESALIDGSLRRFGGSAVHFLSNEKYLDVLDDILLAGEVYFSLNVEQAESLDDIVKRRLGLEFRADHGLPVINSICSIGQRERTEHDWGIDRATYKTRLKDLHALLRIPSCVE